MTDFESMTPEQAHELWRQAKFDERSARVEGLIFRLSQILKEMRRERDFSTTPTVERDTQSDT